MVYTALSDDSSTQSQFTRRESIVVTTTGTNTPSNYQAKLTITYESEMQSDFGDIRFNTKDGRYIDYWMESYVASTSAVVWLELPDAITDPGSDTVQMYYGNSGLSNGGVGADTFLQFHGAASSNFIDSLNISPTCIFEAKARTTGTTSIIRWGLANNQDPTIDDCMFIMSHNSANLKYINCNNEGTTTNKNEAPKFVQNTWYRIKIINTGTAITGFVDDDQISTGDITTNLPNENLGLFMQNHTSTGAQEWSFARKYITNEPTVSYGPVYLIQKWTFEDWSSGPSSAPDGWTNSGLASITRDTKHKYGLYSAKLGPNNITDFLYHNLSNYSIYRGETISFGCWCWSDTASQMRLFIEDGVSISQSAYHSGNSTWEWLTVTRTIDAAATFVYCMILPSATNGSIVGYADSGLLVEGSEILESEPETVILDGDLVLSWMEFETIDSISIGAKTFKCLLENTDNAITNSYEAFDTALIYADDTIVFNGRIEEIIPNESEATLELAGKDYMGDLIGEYIIENYGISQDMSNNEAAGSDVVIEITDTTGFEVDDEIKVEDDNDAETAVITAVVANTSLTVATLTNSYTTAANAKVTVGRPGSYIVNDLVLKYGASMTRVGIQTSTNKFIILFKGITAFDAIQYIADSEEFEFGQDQDKDFFYQPRTFEDSGLSIDLDVDDVMDYSFPRPGYEIINRVDIYGGTSGGVQVAIRVEDPTSQNYYGIIKGMTIIDEKITTELQAQARANAILSEKAWVIQIGELSVLGYETLQAGQLVSLANFDSIDDGLYLVTEKMHLEPPGNTLIKVAEYRAELEDVIIDLLKRMRAREKEAMDEDAFQTKFLNFYVTSLNADVIVNVIQVDINDGYITAHKTNSLVGRGYDGVGGNQLKVGRYQTETVII